jgi:hypothetical protein
VIKAGFFVAFGIARDVRRSARHQQPFDIFNRRKGAGFRFNPSFLARGIAFVDQAFDVNLAERDVSILIDTGDRDRAGSDHGTTG